eukprot:1363609-Rhodomonas_salina.2
MRCVSACGMLRSNWRWEGGKTCQRRRRTEGSSARGRGRSLAAAQPPSVRVDDPLQNREGALTRFKRGIHPLLGACTRWLSLEPDNRQREERREHLATRARRCRWSGAPRDVQSSTPLVSPHRMSVSHIAKRYAGH